MDKNKTLSDILAERQHRAEKDEEMKTLIDKERELFNKIGLFAAGMPSLEQAKMMDDFMLENCKFYKGNNVCSLPNEKCESMPSECIYRKLRKLT